jgi:hypothetical protein
MDPAIRDKPLELRKVEIDFSDAKIHGNPAAPEYSHILNGVSALLPDLEAFLNKVVRSVAQQLPEDAAELRKDVRNFTWQEGRHAKMHAKFNELLLAEPGYEWLRADQERLKQDYERFLRDKGLRFCLAYSEGFETYGTFVSYFYFEGPGRLMEDWDEPMLYLHLWHLAEEWEHRTVCNHLYKAIYDDAYWMRIYGLWYATIHLFGFTLKCARKFIAADLERGRIRGRLRSRLRFIRDMARFFGYVVPRQIGYGMRPGWDPIDVPPPRRCLELLADVSQRYGIREPL